MTEADDPDGAPRQHSDGGTGAGDAVPPRTGDPAVDDALATLTGLESRPLSEHHDELAGVLQQLHRVLNPVDESGVDDADPTRP